MNWDTLQWILGIVLFVVFLAVMMRGCGGMMGGCGGMGPSRGWGRRGGHCAGPEEGTGGGAPSERGPAPAPERRSRQDQQREDERYGRP